MRIFKQFKAFTLTELLIVLVILSIMILTFYTLENYGHLQLVRAQRRTKVQNELALSIEHMSKYIQQANGNINNSAIELYSLGTYNGFRVRFDCMSTPSDLSDDVTIDYYIGSSPSNELLYGYSIPDPSKSNSNCIKFMDGFFLGPTGVLSNRILPNFVNGTMPIDPQNGFYVNIDNSGTSVEVGLVGRYDPTRPADPVTNPQVEMKTKIFCNSSSTN